MRKSPLSSNLINLSLLIVLAVIWIAFAPKRIGGLASYVVVNGNSMEPDFHRGDLAILHTTSSINVGDVVTYQNPEINAFVIHRIVAIEDDHYVFKGDNNAWIDTYRPTRAELIGKLWIHAPKLGKTMTWLRLPINMAVATGLLGGMFMAGILIKPNKRRKRRNNPSGHFGDLPEAWVYLFGCCALVFLSLAIVAFIRPLTHPADKLQYEQESQFSYSATGTAALYDTEMVRSGEPVFPRLTCFLNITFTYNVLGSEFQDIAGQYQVIARVMDENTGWRRTIPMSAQTAFQGNSFSTAANLDLCQIVALVDTLKQQTGLRAGNFTLEIIPQVMMTANAAGNQIVDSFEPKLVFEFDEVHFSLSSPKGQDDPLHVSKQSLVSNSNLEPNVLTLLTWQPTVRSIRLLGLLGFVLSFSGLLVVGSRVYKKATQNHEALIRLRYGGLLVNIYERDLEPASMLMDVPAIEELAKLAERHNTVILHMTTHFLHFYLVQCNGVTYRYVYSDGKRGVAEIEQPSRQVIDYVTGTNKKSVDQIELNEDGSFGFVINQTRTTKAEVTDTVVLRKVRL